MVSGWLQRTNLVSALLFLSLGSNLFFMGWLLGGHPHVHRHVSGFLGPPPPSDRFGDQIQMALSPAGAAIMEDAFETVRRRFTSAADNARETHERIKAAMTAEPFDASRFIEASKSARSEREKDRAAADDEIARAIARLSPDDRRKLAEIHPPMMPRFGGRGGPGPFH